MYTPAGIAVDVANQRLYIADTGRHRILVCDLTGNFLAAIGGQRAGLQDGKSTDAQFNSPRGIALDRISKVNSDVLRVGCVY